jgi:hypothetical protein
MATRRALGYTIAVLALAIAGVWALSIGSITNCPSCPLIRARAQRTTGSPPRSGPRRRRSRGRRGDRRDPAFIARRLSWGLAKLGLPLAAAVFLFGPGVDTIEIVAGSVLNSGRSG